MPLAFETPFFGYRYAGRLDQYIDWWVYFFGAYEYADLQMLRRLAEAKGRTRHDRPVLYDIGANVGHHTLFAARFARQVVAFEPYAPVRGLLEQKLALNAIGHVRCFPFGLGDADAQLGYHEPPARNTGSGYFDAATPAIGTLALDVRVGDDVVREAQLPGPDFIKIDVEGFEPFALAGLRHTLERYRPVVMAELSEACGEHMRRLGKADFFALLPAGYAAYTAAGRRLRPTRPAYDGNNYFFIPDELALP